MSVQVVAKIVAFVLYLGFMIYIGLRSAKNNNSPKDFFLGGRKVGPWVTALSAEASDSSAWLLMGLPGLCYLGGIKETVWTSLGLIVGTYLNWLFVAKPLRKCSVAFDDAITIPSFFSRRFNDKSHVLTIVSAFFIVFFFTIYTASGFVACAKLFRSVFGLNYYVGLIIGLVVILTYTILGGYLAVCTTDFLQGSLIFIAFVISSIILVITLGGPGNAIDQASQFNALALAGQFGEEIKNAFAGNSNFSLFSGISAFSWCLGYFGMPHIIIRFMGIRSNDEIKKARRIGTSWMVISYIGTFIIGTLGTVYLAGSNLSNPVMLLTGGAQETVFSETMLKMYPAFIAGLFLCAILAASMSTADSQLLSASSSISFDIYKGIINKDADEKKVLLISRISVLVIAIIAFGLCLLPNNDSIFGLVSYAWAGFGATFGPLILLSLFWKNCTKEGAISGIIGGGITVVAWHNFAWMGGIFKLYEIVPGFIVCLLLAVVVSLCTKKDEEVLAAFDKYKALAD
ncbi:MAG: sodium/proline symporter PutP [Spirochaetaceae bacterium]|nr:sodium/proline symporter PutP [Spirochaetaceae bacterium]MDD6487814.1 sodium/proline symporter PutP [Spirochaetales bacterium]